ncbi:3-isopropylmalate dehydratase small subunit [bacterium]|nr:3-isopropylmalate dehydratase small subunit [bacterium]
MKTFTTLRSHYAPLPIRDVDTDMIIPAQFLTSISREGYGENLFRRLRDEDPEFPPFLPPYRNAKILVTRENFGCGSSREHAVWALMSAGYEAVIAPSFADIFHSNSGKNGLLLVELPEEVVNSLLQQTSPEITPLPELTIDLTNQTVALQDGEKFFFPYDPFRKECLLAGMDDLDYLLNREEEITLFREQHEKSSFFDTRIPNHHGGPDE